MAANKLAIVTGSNKGIGFEICKQLASKGVTVVLTARDEQKGAEALEKLKGSGLSDKVIFHKLDVVDPSSVTSFADFIKNKFGKLDILVNNAGIDGAYVDPNALQAMKAKGGPLNLREIMTEPYETAVTCFETNYYGMKRMTEAFASLLQSSDSPRIVNIGSSAGKLQNINNEWAKSTLGNAESLTEEKIEEVVTVFLKDFKEGSHSSKGWPAKYAAYIVSKAAVHAYTRIAPKKYPSISINCVCPGYVATDLNHHTGILTVEEGAATPVWAALLPHGGPSGVFYVQRQASTF